MFHTCSPFLPFLLVHSLPENQIAALKGNANSPKLTKKGHRENPHWLPNRPQSISGVAGQGLKLFLASVHSPSYTSLFETRKQTPTHLFILSLLPAGHRALSPPPLKTQRKKVCSPHPSTESASCPRHLMCYWHVGDEARLECFAFSGCRFGRCPLFPSKGRKTDCQRTGAV